MVKIFEAYAEYPMGSKFHFPMKNISQFIDKFLKFEEKFQMWPALCKVASYFQR